MPEPAGRALSALYRYPVKGLSPEPLEKRELTSGETLPFDRAYAIENGPGRFDPDAPRHLPKINFLMLMRDERLATLRAVFDDATETLTICRDGKQVARGQLDDAAGPPADRAVHGRLHEGGAARGTQDRAGAGHSFSDMAAKCVHIVNLASVREVERITGRPVDPLRFRANLYLDGMAPGPSLAGSTRRSASAPARTRRVRAHAAVRGHQRRSRHGRARHGDPRAPACARGDTRISASMPRS